MISQLRGVLAYVGDKWIIVDVGGVGYKVNVTTSLLAEFSGKELEREKVFVWTYLAVREDAMELYGFTEKSDLNFFELLISISGIGPKKAIGILSVAPVETLRKAIRSRDTSYLTRVSGIGQKNAEKIVMELKDKFEAIGDEVSGGPTLREESDVIEAIKALGYSASEAREALSKVPADLVKINDKIRSALKYLSR